MTFLPDEICSTVKTPIVLQTGGEYLKIHNPQKGLLIPEKGICITLETLALLKTKP